MERKHVTIPENDYLANDHSTYVDNAIVLFLFQKMLLSEIKNSTASCS